MQKRVESEWKVCLLASLLWWWQVLKVWECCCCWKGPDLEHLWVFEEEEEGLVETEKAQTGWMQEAIFALYPIDRLWAVQCPVESCSLEEGEEAPA